MFTGIDLRWTAGGVQVSGEWITGRPFDGTSTTGWHADVMVHRPVMGPVTAVWRSEQLDYARPRRSNDGPGDIPPAHGSVCFGISAAGQGPSPERQPEDADTTALDGDLTYSIRLR